MKCNRRESLKQEIVRDWDKLNLAAKILLVMGIVIFLMSIFVALINPQSVGLYKSIEVVFRSSLASIFGFILSSNMKSHGKDNRKISETKDEEESSYNEPCVLESRKYNYTEGNMIQLLSAFFICLISSTVIFMIYAYNIEQDVAAISQFRDLMCTTIGFLVGESKIKK